MKEEKITISSDFTPDKWPDWLKAKISVGVIARSESGRLLIVGADTTFTRRGDGNVVMEMPGHVRELLADILDERVPS